MPNTLKELKDRISTFATRVEEWDAERQNLTAIMEEREEEIRAQGKSSEEIKAQQKALEAKIKVLEDGLESKNSELYEAVKAMRPELDELAKRIGASSDRGGEANVKTPGQAFAHSEAVQQFHEAIQSGGPSKTPDISVSSLRAKAGVRMAADSVLSDQTANFVEPFRPDLIAGVERRFFFRDLIGTTPVTSNAVTHIRELGFRSDADVLSVSSITQTGGVATLVTATAHNLVEGNLVEVAGADQPEYNKVAVVKEVVDSTTLKYDVDAGAVSPSSGTRTATRLVLSGAAAGTAEGSAMGQASVRFEEESLSIRLVGHWIAVSQILLDDLPAMASLIDRRLVYGIEYEIEEQGLYGTGSGQEFSGLFTHPRRLQLTKGSDTLPDALLRGLAHGYQADYEPTVIWMAPMDFYYGDGTNDGLLNYKSTGGEFQFLRLGERAATAINNTRIVISNSVKVGDVGIVDLQKAATLYDRQAARMSVTNSHGTDFPANMLAIKAYERLALGVHYGPAFIHMDLTS